MRIGIDLGGTSVKAALCNDGGAILQRDSVPTPVGDPDGLRGGMKTLALRLCQMEGIAPDTVSSIGLGLPGSLDKANCRLIFGTNLDMRDVMFGDAFQPEFSCPVKLDNDANCAALGEATAGAGSRERHMLMVTLGTGVGGGIVIDGKLYAGCNDIAGEIGHMVIRQGGEPCNCGRKGCLEAYASASHFVKFAERALDAGRESVLSINKGHLNAKMICDAVDAGDALAIELFEGYCQNLSCGLANLINIFQPDCIVLGGGLAGYGEKLIEPLRRLTFPETFRCETKNTRIVLAALGNDAGLIGAAML
ncbi:ROK family protein [Agathobaculum sp.]|uniref:ROK family protein n=1 Tax=Agathobaculum sp. TaxID=2048138 RepID=UPI002A82EC7C|nr:ROK family protein [Agathobaculum sp.]MDY3618821.1 ROK family protein [Agathobaculum sp.]